MKNKFWIFVQKCGFALKAHVSRINNVAFSNWIALVSVSLAFYAVYVGHVERTKSYQNILYEKQIDAVSKIFMHSRDFLLHTLAFTQGWGRHPLVSGTQEYVEKQQLLRAAYENYTDSIRDNSMILPSAVLRDTGKLVIIYSQTHNRIVLGKPITFEQYEQIQFHTGVVVVDIRSIIGVDKLSHNNAELFNSIYDLENLDWHTEFESIFPADDDD